MRRETKLSGTCVVPGKGLGKAYFVGRAVQESSVVSISRQDVGDQIMLFNEIKEKAKADYRQYTEDFGESASVDASILHIYEHILDDPAFIGQVVETISTKLYDLETAVRFVSNDFIKRFNSAGTSYFRERSSDMVEVCEKLISYLHLDDGRQKGFLEPVVLVVLRTFTPSDLLAYDRSRIQGIICVSGGKTSHAAILARSYNIPVVTGIKGLAQQVRPGDQVLVEADKGLVYVRPTAGSVGRFEKHKVEQVVLDDLRAKWNRPAYTRDGVKISVMANVSLLEDVGDSWEHGADSIGLIRTEYLLANRKNMPSKDVQQAFYRNIFKEAGGKHCTVRLMDIGGDKIPSFFDMPSEYNPFMGWRAIRIFLERKDLFETQLSAIMKAGHKKKYSIMIPMVTTLQEWQEAKKIVAKVANGLGVPIPPCGVLFEVPLAVLEMASFMKEIDFASIGTNDLIQYLSAADRNNAKVNYLYDPIEPAFLRIVRTAIEVSNSHGKPVSICGEMAGNPYYTALLVGLGLRRFSVMPRSIPIIKELVSRISRAEAAEAVSHLDAIETTKDSVRWVRHMNRRLLGEAFQKLPISADN